MPAAEEHLKSEGLFDRIELKAGDYNSVQLPEDFDVVLLSNMKNFCELRDFFECFI